MELIKDIDTDKTIRKARNFLTKQLPKMQIQANLTSMSIKSPTISDMPTGSMIGNSNEEKNVLMLQRQEDVKHVAKAIIALPSFEGYIINAVYLEHKSDIEVSTDIDYSMSRYQHIKRKALLDFAVAMQVHELDIVVYKK